MPAEYYLGEITLFAGNYAPRDWMFCDGSLLSISEYPALYSLLSNYYGGDGVSNFALPDLRDRFPVHCGNNFQLGQQGGNLTTTIKIENMPTHNHSLVASTENATETAPDNNVLAVPQSRYGTNIYAPVDSTPLTNMNPDAIGKTGDSQPLNIVPPFATLNFIICVEGMYPPRP